MSDSFDAIRSYCEGVIRTQRQFGGNSRAADVADNVLRLLKDPEKSESDSTNVFNQPAVPKLRHGQEWPSEQNLNIVGNVVGPSEQIRGKRA